MKSGVIKIVLKNDWLLKESSYVGVERRKTIIELYQKIYGEAMGRKCFLQICPDTDDDLVSEVTGKNIKRKEKEGPSVKKKEYDYGRINKFFFDK